MNATPDERTIVVTGASSGIGRSLAIEAAREGFRVLLVARRADRIEEAAAQIRAAGGTCATLAVDVTATDAARRIVDATMQAFGRIDIVVNNAGYGALGKLLEIDDAAIEAQWKLHVLAPIRIARAALPHVRATHGQFVFVGSGIARVPVPNYGAYALAKAAIRAAAIQLRRELKSEGIAVTYLDPGLVATGFHDAIGTQRPTDVPAAPPERVARAVLRGIKRRSAAVAGTTWQTIGTVIGEWASTLADPTIIRMAPSEPILRQAQDDTEAQDDTAAQDDADTTVTLSVAQSAESKGALDEALEPVARRMERVKLTPAFVRGVLLPGAELELNEVAMRWAGMPNKNERAAVREVFDALSAAGYLEPTGDETWKVLRAAD